MLNRIKAVVGTIVMTGMLVLPAWAQITFPPAPPTTPGTGCANMVAESEPNDGQTGYDVQDLGMLQSGACVTVSPASIDGGAQSAEPDLDIYLLGLSGVSQLDFALQLSAQTPFGYVVVDLYTMQPLAECYEATCQVTVQTDFIGIGVMAMDVAQYSLTITGVGGPPPFAGDAVDTVDLTRVHERFLKLR
jgi:hypothetical protein